PFRHRINYNKRNHKSKVDWRFQSQHSSHHSIYRHHKDHSMEDRLVSKYPNKQAHFRSLQPSRGPLESSVRDNECRTKQHILFRSKPLQTGLHHLAPLIKILEELCKSSPRFLLVPDMGGTRATSTNRPLEGAI